MAKVLLLVGLLCLTSLPSSAKPRVRQDSGPATSTTTTTTTWDEDHEVPHEDHEDPHEDHEDPHEESEDHEDPHEEEDDEDEYVELSEKQLTALYAILDTNHNGVLTFEEAFGHVMPFFREVGERDAKVEMMTLDVDRDYKLTVEEAMEPEEEEDKGAMMQRFHAADVNKDSKLNLPELASYLHPWTDEATLAHTAEGVMELHDNNFDGVLSKEEFHEREGEAHGEDYLDELFTLADKDGSGGIDLEELMKHESGLVDYRHSFQHFFTLADPDGDKSVTLEEFLKAAQQETHHLRNHFSSIAEHHELHHAEL